MLLPGTQKTSSAAKVERLLQEKAEPLSRGPSTSGVGNDTA